MRRWENRVLRECAEEKKRENGGVVLFSLFSLPPHSLAMPYFPNAQLDALEAKVL